MKRIIVRLSLMAVAVVSMASCGGGSAPKARMASVSLDELDDYFTVTSYTIDSDVKEKGVDRLAEAKGTLTLVVKRNNVEMKYKPSDVEYAKVAGDISTSDYYVFRGDCDAAIKKLLKVEPGKEETIDMGFRVIEPENPFDSDEEKAQRKQNIFDALTKPGCLDQIVFDVEFKGEELEELKALKELDSYYDDDDDE